MASGEKFTIYIDLFFSFVSLMKALSNEGIRFKDLNTQQSSLEEIFIDLVNEPQTEKEGVKS